MVKEGHPKAITADGGGSNGYWVRLWKIELQNLAQISHYRLSFSTRSQQVEQNRASPHFVHQYQLGGKPLRTYRRIVQLIAATTTNTELKDACLVGWEQAPQRGQSVRCSTQRQSTSRATPSMVTGITRSSPAPDGPRDLVIYGRLLTDALHGRAAASSVPHWPASEVEQLEETITAFDGRIEAALKPFRDATRGGAHAITSTSRLPSHDGERIPIGMRLSSDS